MNRQTGATMRNLGAVMDKLLSVVPETESGMRADLDSLFESIKYSAPEMVSYHWDRLGAIVNQYMPLPGELSGWQQNFVFIFIGQA